jgi:hypothetical protein
MPRSEASTLPTRRQLDELDALLQRMLELPVNHTPEEGLAQDEQSVAENPPFTETSAWTSRWEETTATSELDREPLAPPPRESPTEWHSRLTQSPDAATNVPDPSGTEFPPLSSENVQPEQEIPDSEAWENIVNRPAIDSTEEPSVDYAKVGRRRTQPPTFQVVLGWLGLLCLVASLALLAYDWFGWTW